MIILLSPSKKMDEKPQCPASIEASTPEFGNDAYHLIEQLRQQTPDQISALMNLSHSLTELNVGRYQAFTKTPNNDNAYPASLMFKGNVYDGLQADMMDDAQLQTLQQKVRILSGLYGVLRPLDAMQPYRLEMGTRFANDRGKNLYAFWQDILASYFNKLESDVILNLASNEYFKAANAKALKAKIITANFKEYKNGAFKPVMVHVKKARGLMARYVVVNNIDTIDEIKNFDSEGYRFLPEHSTDVEWIFGR